MKVHGETIDPKLRGLLFSVRYWDVMFSYSKHKLVALLFVFFLFLNAGEIVVIFSADFEKVIQLVV